MSAPFVSGAAERGAWLALAAAAALLAFAPLPVPLAVATAVLVTLVAPGAWFARAWAPGWSAAERLGLALAVSPALVAAPAALASVLGLPFTAAARLALVLVGALALVEGLAAPAARLAHRHGAAAPASSVAALVCAGVWAAIVAALLAGNPWLAPRSDGWFHAGVTLQVAQRGLPPEDPYFAGVPLLYFWGEHAWAALWLAVQPAVPVWAPLVAFNVAAAAAVLLGVATLVRVLGGGGRAVVLASLLTVAGYAPGAWVWIVGRAVIGSERGFGEIVTTLGYGIDPVLSTLAQGLLHGSLAFFGDKYLVPTPFSMGLALFAYTVALLVECAERRGAAAVRLAVVLAAALFLHAVVGDAALLMAAAVAAVFAMRALRSSEARATLASIGLAVLAAALLLTPYLASITAGKHGQLVVQPGRASLQSLLWCAALVLPAGGAWLALHAGRRPAAVAVLAAVTPLVLLAVVVRLPENNQSKFVNLLALVLAAPAALGWSSVWGRSRAPVRAALAAAGVVLALPTAALALAGFAMEHGQSRGSWKQPDAAGLEAMAWVRAHTPADAMLVDLAGAADVIALGGRSVLWGGPRGERDWGGDRDELQWRRLAATALAHGAAPRADEAARITALGREVIVVARASDAGEPRSGWNMLPHAPGFRELHRTASVALYRWEGAR